MRYAEIKPFDVANSPDVGATLFVTGCTHKCEGCFNSDLQSFECGKVWSKKEEDYFIECCQHPQVHVANILGGEPMQQDDSMLELVKRIKKDTDCKIWLWSGYTFEELLQFPQKIKILQHIDVLVDGKFILKMKDLKLRHRGSSNQRIIDVSKSLESNSIVLYDLD